MRGIGNWLVELGDTKSVVIGGILEYKDEKNWN